MRESISKSLNLSKGTAKQIRLSVAGLVILCLFFSVFMRLIPPMQSPDEGHHLLRAHLLSKGVFVLDTIPGQPSGGYVDESLWNFQQQAAGATAFYREKKVTKAVASALASIEWSGKPLFAPIPTTGYYFPLIYAPQAIGLSVGELLGLTVQKSYYLARLSAFLASMLLIGIGFRLYPPNPLAIALLILPISLFQFFSASMDGVALALTLLCISLFMRAAIRKACFPDWMSFALVACLFILVTSRIQVLAFMLMPFVLAIQQRRALYLWQGLGLAVFVVLWLYLAITLTNDGGVNHPGHTHVDVVKHYLTNVPELGRVLMATVGDVVTLKGLLFGFIGILGWLDTPFSSGFYKAMAIGLAILTLLSISRSNIRTTWQPRVALLLMFLASVFTVFFALLIQWNPFPATIIEGIQGRYFIAPVCALAYALSGDAVFGSISRRIAIFCLVAMLAMVAIKMPHLLLDRYFIG